MVQFFRETIFGRLIRTFLIVLIPLYMFGFFMNQWGVRTTKNQISESMNSQVTFFVQDMENEIQSIKMLQYDCLSDENLNRLAIVADTMNLYEKQQRMLQLQKRLVTIRNSSAFIDDVSVHIEPIGKTITANNGIVPLNEDEFEQVRIVDMIDGAQIIHYGESLYLSTYDAYALSNRHKHFSITIRLNRDNIMNQLNVMNVTPESGVALVYNFGNHTVLDSSTGSDFEGLSKESLLKYVIEGEGTYEEYTAFSKEIVEKKSKYYASFAKSDYLHIYLIKYTPSALIMEPLQKVYMWFILFTITSLILLVLYSISTYKYIHEPLSHLVEAFKYVEEGKLDVSIQHEETDEFSYIYSRFNNMVYEIKTLINQVYKQKILTQQAELKQLQSQINPHFLYNSFFQINTMARLNDDHLIPFTKKLGEYFRFVTKNTQDQITLLEEVNHAKVYTDIQKMRFSKRLTLSFDDLPEQAEGVKVPRLIIQPLIENAFEHALEKQQKAELLVAYSMNAQMIAVHIEDNGKEVNDDVFMQISNRIKEAMSTTEMSGMLNVHRRIRLLYGKPYGLLIGRSRLGGTKLTVLLPLEGEKHV